MDKLARVWRTSGDEVWALIHTDIQMNRETDFDQRMYVYNYRIFDRFKVHAASFALIGGGSGNWNPGFYENGLWGCRVRFEFPVVRLSDYKDGTAGLKNRDNPFRVVVQAHLKTEETAGDKTRRRREKLELVKQLYHQGWEKTDIVQLFRFIDWIMKLPEVESQLFWHDLAVYEKEAKMPYVTSVEKIGFQKGIQQGIDLGRKQGIQHGETLAIARMVARKFGESMDEIRQLIGKLPPEKLEEITDQVFELDSFEEFRAWVKKQME